MRKLLDGIGWMVAILIVLIVCSCNTQRHTQSNEVLREQANVVRKDSLQHSEKDTASKQSVLHNTTTSKDSSRTITKNVNDSSSVSVTFNGGATDKPIVIQDSAGKTVIDAGGRNVTNVNIHKSKTTYQKKKEKGSISKSATTAKADSSGVKLNSATKINNTTANNAISDTKTVKTDKVSKASFLARFGVYFIILILLVVVYCVWKYWTRIINIFK